MTVKDKILTYIKDKGITRADFFEKSGVSESNFKGDAKKSELGCEKLVKILTAYPDLSAEWLLRNNGAMCLNNEEGDILPESSFTQLLQYVREKDAILNNQCKKIGQLEEKIQQLTQPAG